MMRTDITEEVEYLKGKSEKYGDIEVFASSKGGKHLADTVSTDIINTITAITQSYKTSSHPELVAMCADLKASISMLRVLKNAKDNKEEVNKMLEELLDSSL